MFHAYVLFYSSYIEYSKWYMYMFSYAIMCSFLYMYACIFLKCVVGLTITLDCKITCLPCCDAYLILCSLINSMVSQVCVRTAHAPYLAYCNCHTLATNKEILLASMQNRVQGITIQPTTRTPININESNTVNIYGTRRRAKWQLVPSHPVLNLCISIMESFTLLPPRCFSHVEFVTITR